MKNRSGCVDEEEDEDEEADETEEEEEGEECTGSGWVSHAVLGTKNKQQRRSLKTAKKKQKNTTKSHIARSLETLGNEEKAFCSNTAKTKTCSVRVSRSGAAHF